MFGICLCQRWSLSLMQGMLLGVPVCVCVYKPTSTDKSSPPQPCSCNTIFNPDVATLTQQLPGHGHPLFFANPSTSCFPSDGDSRFIHMLLSPPNSCTVSINSLNVVSFVCLVGVNANTLAQCYSTTQKLFFYYSAMFFAS